MYPELMRSAEATLVLREGGALKDVREPKIHLNQQTRTSIRRPVVWLPVCECTIVERVWECIQEKDSKRFWQSIRGIEWRQALSRAAVRSEGEVSH